MADGDAIRVCRSCPCGVLLVGRPGNARYCSQRCKERAKDPIKLAAKKARWHRKNADRISLRNKLDPVVRARRILNSQKHNAKRSAWIASTDDGTLTPSVVAELFAKASHCPYCSSHMGSMQKSLDHIQPLSRGGRHAIGNVVVCCKTCNTSKGTRVIAKAMSDVFIHGVE